ncbi:hypothetical protein [Paenibacillus apii]|uniref:hypothetical protein n=1 Tax=Paenibacillus apii TaxID=1850370 RepID=UPI00143C6E07|nr:hypothetical protein [Paenibacillus apii]NJJ37804.1 hypothetical protein [Paenibacillus apii]
MTAEIGVMNTIGIALAADSAVTIGKNKIFNTADKLFSLSKNRPVGIMIYGSAGFMGVPWETVIKLYRKELDSKLHDQGFDTIQDYCDDFINYLEKEERFKNSEYEKTMVYAKFSSFFSDFLAGINEVIAEVFNTVEPEGYNVQHILFAEANYYARTFYEQEFAKGFDENYYGTFFDEFNNEILEAVDDMVNIDVDQETFNLLLTIAASIISKHVHTDHDTGVVIAGFGEMDIFPSLRSYVVEGYFSGVLKYEKAKQIDIDAINTAAIVPFAQQEMVHSFLTGIDPKLKNEVSNFIHAIVHTYPEIIESLGESEETLSIEAKRGLLEIGSQISNEFIEQLEEIIQNKYTSPVINTVSSLPKEELAAMAEALVNLTSIKRKMSNETETVGGPIDVAVISKGDGFIWIKRKHYFSPDLNHNYFQNYLKR